ncbi:MAG TPA: extracellular solute-binding protein [Bauldia sp.]|nr:extracellular solute-binding protein [Bauldia sp.]
MRPHLHPIRPAVAAVLLAGCALVAVPALAEDVTLTVWDWKSGDPAAAPYFEKAKEAFEAAHPGVTIEYVMQPHDQYYTVLGTAVTARQGPDVVLLHGGARTKERTDALVNLDGKVADIRDRLAGWEEFLGPDGSAYAIPISIQGFAVYYNKELYAKAGLDPEKPPQTWTELSETCAKLVASGVACFVLGNKEGYAAEFFFSSAAANYWTKEQQDAWAAGRLTWTDPAVKKILELWVESNQKGWYPKGANSTAMFMDSFEAFERGDGANVIGLISDVAHWKQFEDFLGADKVGVYRPVAIEALDADLKLPVAGGIGYAVTTWSPHQDLAVEFAKSLASPENLAEFFRTAGAIVPDKSFDVASVESPGAATILGWIGCCSAPMAHNAMGTAELEEFHRQSQLLLNGDTTVDAAAETLAKLRPANQ